MSVILFVSLAVFSALVYYTIPPKKKEQPVLKKELREPPPWDVTDEEVKLLAYMENPPKMPKLETWEEIIKELVLLQDQTHMCEDEIQERLRNVDRARFKIQPKNGVASV